MTRRISASLCKTVVFQHQISILILASSRLITLIINMKFRLLSKHQMLISATKEAAREFKSHAL